SAGGAAVLPVEDPRDLGVVVVDGEPADQADSVLIGAQPAGRGGVGPGGPVRDRPALSPQDPGTAGAPVVAVDGDVDLVQQGAQQLFAVLVGGGGRVPDGLQIIAEGEDRGALGGGEGCRAGGLAAGELGFGGGQVGERFLPGGFQAAGDQPVAGVDGLVAALGLGGRVAGLLDLAAPLLQGSVVPLLELPGGLQAGAQRHWLQRGQERAGDGGVDGHAAGPQVPGAAAFDQLPGAGAVVARGGLVLALVVDGELAAAGAAGGQALQQCAALTDRAGARLMSDRADVLGDLCLVGLVGVPVGESLVVVFDQHLPLVLRQHPAPDAQRPIVADRAFLAAAAEGIRAGVGGVGQHVVHRVVGRLGPDDLRSADIGAGLQRELQALVAQPQPVAAHRAAD